MTIPVATSSPRSGLEDNVSCGAADARKHVPGALLVNGEVLVGVHMDGTGQHSRCAGATLTLATAEGDFHSIFLGHIEQNAAGGKLAYGIGAHELDRRERFTLGRPP